MRPASIVGSRTPWALRRPLELGWGLWPAAWALLLLVGIFTLMALAIRAATLESLSWLLVILVSCGAAFLAVRYVVVDAQEPESRDRSDEGALAIPGELRSLSRVIARARSGSGYSQAIVAARLARAFLEKVRVIRGLSPAEIEQVRGDRSALRGLIGDPELADFVAENERFTREWPDERAGAGPRRAIASVSRLLDAMEAWS